jgi:ADP-glucose type glycogen/starch synthase
VAFQRHIINHLLDFLHPDVVHCNDWMTGLVPPAAAEKGIKSLFTLHNVFTEKETPLNIDRNGIDVRRFMDRLYFEQYPDESPGNWTFNRIDFAASGIHGADLVNTVSESFLDEIVTGRFRGVIPPSIYQTVREKHKAGKALGILNAPNDSVDPKISRFITPYDVDDVMEKKKINKKTFQERMGLNHDPDAPLFFWPSRLYPQKGPALLQKIIRPCVEELGIQVGIVANGDPMVERFFLTLARKSNGSVAHQPFSEGLSELGKSGADFVLMPSMYEPCGLPQMECPRFGTLPVARLTGGIKDTVSELNTDKEKGNGFVFEPFTPEALLDTIKRAVAFYRLPEEVKEVNIQRIMRESFESYSLEKTAQKYINVYEALIQG